MKHPVSSALHTAADYKGLLRELLSPLTALYRKDCSSFPLPGRPAAYPESEQNFENFSRSLIGLSLLDDEKMTETCFQMIRNGVDPSCSGYWGDLYDESQLVVEQFPVLLFCVRHKAFFEQRFSDEEKAIFFRWFNQVNRVRICDNNWHFFPILVNLFLKILGLPHSDEAIESHWERIDAFYLGHGWYSDGNSLQRDYYNAFGFHFYSLLYAFFSPDEARSRLARERAREFAVAFVYFFSEEGPAVPFGRSLTYRFAQVAFWSLYACFVEDREELGRIKGIVNRNLRWWLSQDITDENGFLVNGYAYDNPFLTEQYNGPGSPYWAFKAFFCLLVPSSAYFEVPESAFPLLEAGIDIPEAFVSIRRSNGNVSLFMNGQRNAFFCGNAAKYEKFVYSSLFAFNVSRSDATLQTLAPDSTLVACIGKSRFVRRDAVVVRNDAEVQISDWEPVPGVLVRSFIFLGAPWHTRVHYILSDCYVELIDFGFACRKEALHTYSEISGKGMATQELECIPCTNLVSERVWIPFVSARFPAGCHLMADDVYGDDIPWKQRPTARDIEVRHGVLLAFGHVYPLPRRTLRARLSKVKQVLH